LYKIIIIISLNLIKEKSRILYFASFMRKFLLVSAILLFTCLILAQSPEKFSYQAIIRDASDNLLSSQAIGLRISILNGAFAVFAETHSTTTDANGLVSVIVGNGTPIIGTIGAIDWGAGTYSIKSETDPSGGNTYSIIQETNILSVPYALFSTTAETALGGNYNNLINKPPAITGAETKISAGTNVTVSGSGTTASPYVINATVSGATYTHYIGELFQGGIVVAVWKEAGVEKGLVASLVSLGNVVWSDNTTAIGATARSPQDGQANTNAMLAQSATAPAAKLCNDYTNTETGTGVYSDWYLPSVWELAQCYKNAIVVDNIIGDADGFGKLSYWSSTEYFIGTNAMVFAFSNGYAFSSGKNNTSVIRAVRKY